MPIHQKIELMLKKQIEQQYNENVNVQKSGANEGDLKLKDGDKNV